MFLHSYNPTLVAKVKSMQVSIFLEIFKISTWALDVLIVVRLDFVYATDFRSSEQSEERYTHDVYTQSGLMERGIHWNWSCQL